MFLSFAETFKALSDPVRREILELLKKGRMSEDFEKSRSYQGNTGEKFYFL